MNSTTFKIRVSQNWANSVKALLSQLANLNRIILQLDSAVSPIFREAKKSIDKAEWANRAWQIKQLFNGAKRQ